VRQLRLAGWPFFRVAVRTEENDHLREALRDVGPRKPFPSPYPALRSRGLLPCRQSILRPLCASCFRTVPGCPFKAQNMSLNSFVTADGGDGTRTGTQAQACRIAPDVRMNPILLSQQRYRCQITVSGRPVENMDVDRYSRTRWKHSGGYRLHTTPCAGA
jgi:hypothetical protein